MRCEMVLAKLNRYVDDELATNEMKTIEAHLQSCDACRKEYQDLLSVNDFLSNFKEEEIDEAIITNIISQSKKSKISSFRRFKNEIISIAASVLLFGSFGLFMGSEYSSNDTSDTFYSFNNETIYEEIIWEQ